MQLTTEAEKIKFRANLIIIKIAFKKFIEISSRKSVKLSDLYIAMGTTREKYTNCCNGKSKSEGPTRTMIGVVQDNKFMLKAIKGEALIVFGRFDGEDDWKRLFDQKEKDSKEYEKGIEEIEKSVNTYLDNFKIINEDKRRFDSLANNDKFKFGCFNWIAGQIVDVDNENKQLLDPVIVKRSEKFFCTTFDELDKCGNETLEHILKKTKELQLQVGTILNYRKYNRKGK